MNAPTSVAALLLLAASGPDDDEKAEARAEAEKLRARLPPGGNFTPRQEEGVFVAAGHGLRVVASRDDGKTWDQVFYAGPCGDHGPWAVWDSVAYTEGVFGGVAFGRVAALR